MKPDDFPRRPLSPTEVEALAALLGENSLLVSPDDVEPFSHDWTEDYRFAPAAVARPKTTEEVSRLLAFCSDNGIPVTPQGGRTGLSGGALPLAGGVALCLDRMNAILEIDEKNAVAVVEPGVITQTLHEAVEALGLYYPPDPASRGSCTIGGNIAENAGGPHAAKYGVTGKWVMGLEAVLPSGQVIVTGGKTRKDVAGFDLTSLLVGSEGTLAVVTKAWLRLIPKPASQAVLVAPFALLEEAMACVVEVYRRGLIPSACEFVDRPAMEVSSRRKGITLPFAEAEARLLLEFDGGGDEEVERDVTRAGEAALDCGALDVVVAADAPRRRELWEIRRGIGEAVRDLGHSCELDVAVPRSELVSLIRGIREIASGAGFLSVAFGHAADGNIHVHVYRTGEDATAEAKFRETATAIYAKAASLGGTVTGEHGVGITSRDHLHLCRPEPSIALMRAIKNVFDPRGILNPGKVLAPLSGQGEPR